jgi:[acyl-carrier-protein] S-malonyltransferase
MEKATQEGARKVLKLAVSIAAHSPLMAHAQDEFNEAVMGTAMQEPEVAVVGNVEAQPMKSVESIQADLQAQLTSRVRWTESIEYMLNQGVDTFIEIGTGDVLSGLIKRIHRGANRLSLGAPQDFQNLHPGS